MVDEVAELEHMINRLPELKTSQAHPGSSRHNIDEAINNNDVMVLGDESASHHDEHEEEMHGHGHEDEMHEHEEEGHEMEGGGHGMGHDHEHVDVHDHEDEHEDDDDEDEDRHKHHRHHHDEHHEPPRIEHVIEHAPVHHHYHHHEDEVEEKTPIVHIEHDDYLEGGGGEYTFYLDHDPSQSGLLPTTRFTCDIYFNKCFSLTAKRMKG